MLTADLPEHGRLLFFYDLCVGGWEQGDRPVHVRWDTTPVSELVSLEVPGDLVAAHEREHEEYLDRCRDFDKTPPRDPAPAVNFYAPARPVTLFQGVTPSDEEDPALEAFMDSPVSDGWEDDFGEFAMECGVFITPEWRHHQLLGAPQSEQSDPGDYMEVDDPEDWRLLLQFSVPGWDAAEDGEGTVYFLINTDDLAARRFDRVQAIYQQT